MALAVAALLVVTLYKGRNTDDPAAAYDLRVYRDQLAEIDRDLGRGVIGTDDAARLRTEVSRRVLDADRALKAAPDADANTGLKRLAVGATVAIILGGSVFGYERLGAPGYPDMPLKSRIAMAEELRLTRPSQAEREAQVPPEPRTDVEPGLLELMAKLRIAVADRPDDLQGQQLLARNEAGLGNYVAAHKAQAQVIAIKGEAATADEFTAHAELQIMAAGGHVSPEAEKSLTEALRRDPKDGLAQYYSGLMFAQIGRPDTAFQIWRSLLENSTENDPWFSALQSQIADLATLAGVHYAPSGPMMPGPGAEDMAAAAVMSEADRQAMIEGMVGKLSERLDTDGGSAEEWARLIGAYGVLKQTEGAAAAWAKAQTEFADSPDDLATVRAAAAAAGVAN